LFSSPRYSEDLRTRAINAVNERRIRNPRDRTIYREIARELGVGEQSLRLWVKKSDQDQVASVTGDLPDAARELGELDQIQMETELKRLRRQLEKLQEENALLKKAFVVFSAEWSK
jgi:transposase-like protein